MSEPKQEYAFSPSFYTFQTFQKSPPVTGFFDDDDYDDQGTAIKLSHGANFLTISVNRGEYEIDLPLNRVFDAIELSLAKLTAKRLELGLKLESEKQEDEIPQEPEV